MRHSPHQLISGRDCARTKVPHASLRGQRGSKEDGTHLLDGVLQPCAQAVTHPPWIGMCLLSVFRIPSVLSQCEERWDHDRRPHGSGQAGKAPFMGVDRFHSNLTSKVRVRLTCLNVPSHHCHQRPTSRRGEGPGPARRGPCLRRACSPTSPARCQVRFRSAKRAARLRSRFSS
jgi:hypothetical protein